MGRPGMGSIYAVETLSVAKAFLLESMYRVVRSILTQETVHA